MTKIITQKEIEQMKRNGEIQEIDSGEFVYHTVDEILNTVYMMLKRMKDDDMVKLKNVGGELFEDAMEKEFSIFSNSYYSIFKLVIDGEPLDMLFEMIEIQGMVNSCIIDKEKADVVINEMLRKKYIPDEVIQKLSKKQNKKMKRK